MNKLYKVLFNIGGCFVVVGFAACRLISEILSLIGLGFDTLGYYCGMLAEKLNALAIQMFDREPTVKETEEEQEEFSWIAET